MLLISSYSHAKVVEVGDIVDVTVEMLMANITKKMIYGQVRAFHSHPYQQLQLNPNLTDSRLSMHLNTSTMWIMVQCQYLQHMIAGS